HAHDMHMGFFSFSKAVLHNILKLLSLAQLLQQFTLNTTAFLICIQLIRKAALLADRLGFLPQGLRTVFQPIGKVGPVFQHRAFQNLDVSGAFVKLHALLLGRYVLGVHEQPVIQALGGRALAFEIQSGPLL
ncbi:hypothetical protein FQV18_0005331, partial [Eudyptula minor novaehollandiae]